MYCYISFEPLFKALEALTKKVQSVERERDSQQRCVRLLEGSFTTQTLDSYLNADELKSG